LVCVLFYEKNCVLCSCLSKFLLFLFWNEKLRQHCAINWKFYSRLKTYYEILAAVKGLSKLTFSFSYMKNKIGTLCFRFWRCPSSLLLKGRNFYVYYLWNIYIFFHNIIFWSPLAGSIDASFPFDYGEF
jgi:hypothetical protein